MGIVIINTCLLWFNMIHFYMLSIYYNKVLKETSANEKDCIYRQQRRESL